MNPATEKTPQEREKVQLYTRNTENIHTVIFHTNNRISNSYYTYTYSDKKITLLKYDKVTILRIIWYRVENIKRLNVCMWCGVVRNDIERP